VPAAYEPGRTVEADADELRLSAPPIVVEGKHEIERVVKRQDHPNVPCERVAKRRSNARRAQNPA